ncbi:MAG: ABC transporter permease [Acidimicrobiia bacterium]|nr:ABC transporter permease [bacterium]MXW59235.1 ABC transporter permease [Acidimicrobiia bacterium]MXZ76754.1 ABC transporter permease [Acidimicrobiia bacterium]MXZ85290.1 ABC transporter permease [Acidimicrobiia bacterium]MYB08486.1 ABC transporter permease [Acidimicrobiia bacterium]
MIFGLRRSVVAATLLATLGAVVLAVLTWKGSQVTSESFLVTTYIGLFLGALWAMYATGLVVVYTTTGVFNFAQGAIGVFSAFLYWELHVNRGWHSILALFVVVCLFAPALGVTLDAVIMRRLRTASLVVQLMVTVAIMVLLLSVVGDIWEADTPRRVPYLFGINNGIDLGPSQLPWHRLIVFAVAIAIAVSMRFLLRRTRIGTAMRAVVDNRELAALNGARPNVVSSTSWALGSMMGALGGILIAPELGLDPATLNNVVIIAFAAAAFGALRNLPMAVIGAMLIGLLRAHTGAWLDFGPDFRFAHLAVAPLILLFVVVALPQARLEVGRLAHHLRRHERYTKWWEGLFGCGVVILLAVVFSGGWLDFGIWDPGAWGSRELNSANEAMALALIGLSLVPLIGWAGQINFAPLAFAGFGAFVYLKLAGDTGNGYWILLVGLLCAPLGALVALPAARLRGLYLALMTMAFAQAMSLIFFPHPWVMPIIGTGRQFPHIELFGVTFDDRRGFFLLMVCVFAIFVYGLVLLRRSRYGRRWMAINDSQAASATLGVPVVWTKVVVYAVSASMAGIAGVFWATVSGNVDSVQGFDLLIGFNIVLLVAAAGVSIPMAGIFLIFIPLFKGFGLRLEDAGNVDFLVTLLDIMTTYGPGLMVLGMVFNPRGAIFEMGRGFSPILPWRSDARAEIAAENAQKREPEIGELGLERPFNPEEVIAIDRRLGILDDVVPKEGYGTARS